MIEIGEENEDDGGETHMVRMAKLNIENVKQM